MRAALASLLLACALGVAGCARAEEQPAASGAELVPADAALFVAVNTDLESEQWESALSLLARFPAAADLLGEARADLEEVEAAGPETDIVLLEAAEDVDGSELVFLTKPADRDAYLRSLEDDVVHEEIGDGWIASSESREALAAFLEARGGEPLAETDAFEQAMEGLDEDALARVYVNGEEAKGVLEESQATRFTGFCSLEADLVSAGAAVRAEDDGIHVDATANERGGEELETYEAELVSSLPAGAVAFVSFNDLERQLSAVREETARQAPEFEWQLGQAERFLGISLEEDVLPLFAGEGALAVYPGTPIPVVSLVLAVDDERRAIETVDDLASRIGALGGAGEPRETEIAGVAAKEVRVAPPTSLFYAAFDGKLVLTTARAGIEGVRADAAKLEDDEAFERAREAAGMPQETTGFVYVNVDDAVRVVEDMAPTTGKDVPSDVRENLEPVTTVLAYGTNEDACFTGFVGIE